MNNKWIHLTCAILLMLSVGTSELLSQEMAPITVSDYVMRSPRLTNLRAVTASGSYFIAPTWSPDGQRLLITAEQYRGLYVVDINGMKEVRTLNEEVGAGYGAAWSKDGTEVFFQQTRVAEDKVTIHREVKSVNVVSGTVTEHPEISVNAIQSFVTTKEASDPIVYVNLESLMIEAKTADGYRRWLVTKDDGPFYRPILSPDKKKILVHKGAFMFVYAADGSGRLASLGRGLGCSWSPDSRLILFFIDEGDGHQITGSELFIGSADGLNNWQLTSTTELHEMWPAWSPNGKRIAFSDHKSGRIFVADLILE